MLIGLFDMKRLMGVTFNVIKTADIDPEKLIPLNCLKLPEWYRRSALIVYRYNVGNLMLMYDTQVFPGRLL